jgi:hypothetical protein
MIEGFPQIISIDWKSAGVDYVGLFHEFYPDLAFFRSDDFEALKDDCATQMPDEVFDALSAFLALRGYGLWNINDGGDNYNLVVAKDTQSKAMAKLAKDVSASEDFECAAERLGLEAAKAAKKAKPPPKKKSQQRLPIIADSLWHTDYGGLRFKDSPIQFLREAGEEEGTETVSLVNFNTWEVEDVPAEGFLPLRQKQSAHLLYGSDTVQFWMLSVDRKTERLVAVSDYQTPIMDELGYGPFYRGTLGFYSGYADTLYFCLKRQDPNLALRLRHNQYVEDNIGQRIMMARDGKVEHLATIDNVVELLPLNENEVMLFQADSGFVAETFTILDVACKTMSEHIKLPEGGFASPFLINENEIGFIQTTKRDKLAGHYDLSEKTGFLCRFNVRTGQIKRAKLDGLENRSRVNVNVLAGQHDMRSWNSFEGFIETAKGHDGWFILNYLSNHAGPTALAWLWNSVDDEILKITTKDFPREDPTIFYNKALNRYQANHACRLDLLIPFEDIYRTRERGKLVWEQA